MSETTLLQLPLLEAAQAQKHVTHNEALLRLDALIQLSVISRALTAAPATPAEGDRYLLGASPTGAWAGQGGKIAAFQSAGWIFYAPKKGWRLWVEDEDALLAYSGTAWIAQGGTGNLQNVPMVGVNATADTTNRLSVSSSSVLLNHAGGGVQLKVNKNAAADTGALLYQTGYSGRAEMGLAGDDNFHFKVSPNGSTWTEAIVIDRTTGAVSLPATPGETMLTLANIANVRDFGALGDNATNDSAAFAAAIATGKPVYVPAGTYYLGASPIAVNNRAFKLFGEGIDVSVLRWAGAGGITISQNSDAFHTRIAGLSLWQQNSNTGTAISYDGSGQKVAGIIQNRVAPRLEITVVAIRGATGEATNGWTKGVAINNAQHVVLNGINIVGQYSGTIKNALSTHGFHIFGDGSPTEYAISNCWCFFTQTAVETNDTEGIVITGSTFVAVGTGVYYNNAAVEPQLCVQHCHISAFYYCVRGAKMAQGNISNNLFYTREDSTTGTFKFVSLESGSYYNQITGNVFVTNVATLDTTGVEVSGAGSDWNVICDNIHQGGDVGTVIGAGCANNRVYRNHFPDTLTTVLTDNGTGTWREEPQLGGTDALPSWVWPGDPDTGVLHPAANEVAIATGGVRRVRFANDFITRFGAAAVTDSVGFEVGSGRSGDGASYVDLVGDTTYSDYGARLIRNGGANGTTDILHRGTGALRLNAQDAAQISLNVGAGERLRIGNNFVPIIGPTATTETVGLEIGSGRTGSGIAHLDLVGDATYTDYGTRLIRGGTGANANSTILHRGTGVLRMQTEDAAAIEFYTANTSRLTIASGGAVTATGSLAAANLSGTNTGDQNATGVAFTPAGGVAATNVQAAIAELDAEKEAAGTASSLLTAHTAAADPHPQYLTQPEGDARYMLIGAGGSGDVVGPASAADNALVRFDGTTGKIIQNSAVLLNDDGSIRLPVVASPAAPAADNVNVLAFDLAGRDMLASRYPAGSLQVMQSLMGRNKIAFWTPPGNATTVPGVFGLAAPTALGTATARNVATTNLLNRQRRLGYVSTATAGNFAGHYSTVAQFSIGDGTSLGGFLAVFRFAVSDAAAVSGARMFVGLRNAVAAPTNVEPSTLTNAIGVAQLSTSGNLQIVYGGSAAQAATDLGANFPANTLSADAYELTLYAPVNSQVVGYRLERLNTGHVASGTLSGAVGTAIPAATTLLAHTLWRCNNATAAAVGLDITSVYIETDY